jgi:hypothetical protein
MTIFQIHNLLMMLATLAALGVFFAIQAAPGLRSAQPTRPTRSLSGY